MIGKVALYLAAAVWIVLVVLWPKSSNVVSTDRQELRQATGEGLYKSTLTKANFGLLGAHFYETDEGRKRWNIRSRFAELHRKENYAYMQQVEAQFFAEKTGNVVETKSDYGRSLIDKHSVELEGNVTIRSKRGYLFSMDKLNYNGDSHEFNSEDPVSMKGPNVERPAMYLKGVGLNADIDREHFLLKKNVAAQKRLKNSEWLKINSKSGEFFTDDQRAIFIGKVHSTLPQMNIDSDIFEISLSHDKEFVLAQGNVILKNRKRVAHAESAFVELGGNKIILEGKARIDSNDNQLTGKRIVLYSDEDRVEVDEAEGRVTPP